jgi:uncharacterized secreted protein with C-terminal beta-propeller domain
MPLGEYGFDSSQPELVAFSSCGELDNFLKVQAIAKSGFLQKAFSQGTSYNPLGFASSTPTGTEPVEPIANDPEMTYSETNLQEEGVDEADIFKVDGRYAYALHGRKLVIIEALGTLDESTGTVLQIEGGQVVAEVELPGSPLEIYVEGDRVVVMSTRQHQDIALQVGASAPARPSGTELVSAIVYDVTDRSKPVIEREVAAEGRYLSSRRIGNQVYIVARSLFDGPDLDEPLSLDSVWRIQRELAIRGASMDEWLPYHYDMKNGAASSKVNATDCTRTFASKATNGDQALSIYSFDLSQPESEIKNYTVLGDGAVVYASTKSIVVALTNYGEMTYGLDEEEESSDDVELFDGGWLDGFDFNSASSNTTTVPTEKTYLHRFELQGDGAVSYHATGTVDGWILNQFSLSEYKGYVRVATMKNRDEWDAESMVFVLQPQSKSTVLQAPTGAQSEFLNIVGSLRGIGEEEDLYATRFVGDTGYLVTFREVDPLWIIDLSQPTQPTLRGHLEVPGYSTYLHPIENKKMLAIGRGSWDEVKLSLFDVGDLDNPRRIDELEKGDDSEALSQHKAFRYMPENGLLAVPISDGGSNVLDIYEVNLSRGFTLKRSLSHSEMGSSSASPQIRRSYRIGDYLYAYSGAGVSITELSDLSDAAMVDLEDVQ